MYRDILEKMNDDQLLGRLITFTIVALILIQTGNVSRSISAYSKMYRDLGAQTGAAAGLFLSTPIWIYWLISLTFCTVLVVKDRYIDEPVPRFLSNFLAFLFASLVAGVIISTITGNVFDLMSVVR